MMNLVRSIAQFNERRICDSCKGRLMTLRLCSSDSQGTNVPSEQTEEEQGQQKNDASLSLDDITEPTNCCMSGCANCVWIQYAEKLSNALEHSNVDVQKVIMEKIQDPNMRAYLAMELRCRNLIK